MMPRYEWFPRFYELDDTVPTDHICVHLKGTEERMPTNFTFEAVRAGLFRVAFTSPTAHPIPPFPSASKPEILDSGLVEAKGGTKARKFECTTIEATIDWTDGPVVTIGFKGQQPLYSDLPRRSYAIDGKSHEQTIP